MSMIVLLRLINIVLLIALFGGLIALAFYVTFRSPRQKPKNEPVFHDDSGVRRLLAEGRFTEAIDLYQAFTNLDRSQAEAAIHEIAHQMGLAVPDDLTPYRQETGP